MVKRKKLDRKRLSTLFTVLMIMFMMVSSVFTSKLIVAEDTETDVVPAEVTEVTENEPTEETEETLSLKEHLKSDSYVQIGYTRVELGEVSEEYNEFGFVKTDETEFVLLLSLEIDENDENEYTYTLPEGVNINVDSLKTSDDLQARLEGNVLTVKKVKVDTPVDNNDDVPAEDSDTPLDNNDIDDNQVNDDLPLDDQLDNNNQSDDDLDVVPADDNSGNTDKNTNENTDNNTNDDTDLNKEDDTQNNGGTALDLPEYKTYVELSGTVLPETETFIVEAFGTFNKAAMMMLGGPLGAPRPKTDEDVKELLNIGRHIIGKQESASTYAWIRFGEEGKEGTQLFSLTKHGEEIDEHIEELNEVPREVEVFISWRLDATQAGQDSVDSIYGYRIRPEGTPQEEGGPTVFEYLLPEGINWDPFPENMRIIYDTNNPKLVNGHFDVQGNRIKVTYSKQFLDRVYNNNAYPTAVSTFTSFITMSGKVTQSDWDDVGNEPYYFEGIGKFTPEQEKKDATVRVAKALNVSGGNMTELTYLGNGKYSVQYKSTITATVKVPEGSTTEAKLTDILVTDTVGNLLSLDSSRLNLKVYDASNAEIQGKIKGNIDVNPDNKSFKLTITELEDKETIHLVYNVILDLNDPTVIDEEVSALKQIRRTFDNEIKVEAENPLDEENPLNDTSTTIDTYTMQNPGKRGVRDFENLENVNWVVNYNVGKFAKDSREWPGVDIGGLFVKDVMGPGQKLVDGTFKIQVSNVGGDKDENWEDMSPQPDVKWEVAGEPQIYEGKKINNQFSFKLPPDIKSFVRVVYTTQSTNQYTQVALTNTASIASNEEGEDEKSGEGSAPEIGPGTLPKISKTGDMFGPDGTFEWTSDIRIEKTNARDVRYYDAMEAGLTIVDGSLKVLRVKIIPATQEQLDENNPNLVYLLKNGKWTKTVPTKDTKKEYVDPYVIKYEKTEKINGFKFDGSKKASEDHDRTDESKKAPWLKADLGESSWDWFIDHINDDVNDITPTDGYNFEYVGDELVSEDEFAVYRITYCTNAPKAVDKDGNPVSRKFLNEGQVRAKMDDTTDEKDRYNTSTAELEKKYIEKAYNDSNYTKVTHESVDSEHGYIGWFIRVYPLDAKDYIEIVDVFTYSSTQTSMLLENSKVHVYVSDSKNEPSADDIELEKSDFTISNSSEEGFTIRINNPKEKGIEKDKFIYVYYQTKVNPRVNNTSIVYTNTASLIRDNDSEYPPAKASTSRRDVVISKSSSRNGNRVTYTLRINKQLLNIDTARQTLTIEDTRGASIEYIEGSMHFYDGSQYNASDKAEKKAEYELTGSPYSVSSTGNTLLITIPDKKYVVIEYEAMVTQKEGELTGEAAENKAVIQGATGFSVKNSLRGKVQNAKAGSHIDNDRPWIKLIKYDRNNHTLLLEGVEFTITGYEFDIEIDPETEEEIVVLKQIPDLEYVVVTDDTGVAYLNTNSDTGTETDVDIVYKIVESKAPSGYVLDSRPRFVLFTDENSELIELAEVATLDGKEVDIKIETSNYLYRFDVENRKTPPNRDIPKTGD